MAIANPTKDPSIQVQFRQLLEEAVTKPDTGIERAVQGGAE